MTPPGGRSRRDSGPALRGRDAECAALDEAVEAARNNQSGVLVLLGDAGVGKSALLDHVAESAPEFRLLRVSGVESERELAFAALHQLCGPLLDRAQELPGPQRAALDTVFGNEVGKAPDAFFVGLAVLSLLSDVSEEQPLLCVVDDAQWLDRASAQVLGFVARRLLAEPVVLLFAARAQVEGLAALPRLEVTGLGDADARLLLASAFPFIRDGRVRDRILAESRGNPLALLELPREVAFDDLPRRAGRSGDQPLSRRLEQGFLARVKALPDDARSLLLLAAAEPLGDATLLWGAARRIGIDFDVPTAGDFTELLTIDDRVTFRHPLVRSAVYSGATMADRRRVHRALSEATDPEVDPDRRAWHMASAADGPDESVAEELERSAGRAQSRGGLVAAAAFLERSATLTEQVPLRVGRALDAARISLHAGDFGLATRMLNVVEAGTTTEDQSAHALLLRGQIAFASGQSRDAIHVLLSAAAKLRTVDPRLARETYVEAWGAAVFAGDSQGDTSLSAVARAAASLPPADEPTPTDILLDGLVALATVGRVAAAPLLRQAIAAFASPDVSVEDSLRWGWSMGTPPAVLWDEDAWHAVSLRQLELMRNAGALARLSLAASSMAMVVALRGDFAAAANAIGEVDAVVEATGIQIAPFGAVVVAALRGREREATALLEPVAAAAAAAGLNFGVQFTRWASAILFNGLGKYEEAFVAAERASAEAPELFLSAWALPELIEASVRSDNVPVGRAALERLADAAAAGDTDWVRGVEARSRALLSEGVAAEACYQQAVERLGRTHLRPELARAHLLYGEWLHREGRRLDAREHLRRAHDTFASVGMEAFAERARRELLATGARTRKRAADPSAADELTPQERQIALLARDGLSNPEIGTRMFLSPRTVEWHLRKVFEKVSISSRTQLRDALPDADRLSPPA